LDARSRPESSLRPFARCKAYRKSQHAAAGRALTKLPNKALRGLAGVSVTIFAFVTDAKQAKRFFVTGFVQGVGFRYFTQDAAERLHLNGYVRNLRDGRVEAYAVGTGEQLADFRSALEQGARFSRVTGVQEEPAAVDPQYANGFVITYDS
jgi:acylphosphatase